MPTTETIFVFEESPFNGKAQNYIQFKGPHTIYLGAPRPSSFFFYQFQELHSCPDCQKSLIECRCGGL